MSIVGFTSEILSRRDNREVALATYCLTFAGQQPCGTRRNRWLQQKDLDWQALKVAGGCCIWSVIVTAGWRENPKHSITQCFLSVTCYLFLGERRHGALRKPLHCMSTGWFHCASLFHRCASYTRVNGGGSTLSQEEVSVNPSHLWAVI